MQSENNNQWNKRSQVFRTEVPNYDQSEVVSPFFFSSLKISKFSTNTVLNNTILKISFSKSEKIGLVFVFINSAMKGSFDFSLYSI